MSDFNAKKLLRKVWARADADGSGELDADELKLVLQAMGQKNPECACSNGRLLAPLTVPRVAAGSMEAVMAEVDTDGAPPPTP